MEKLEKNIILEMENKLYRAIKSSDINQLDTLLHDDLLFIGPDGRTITKSMDMQTYRDGNLKITQLTPDLEELNIIDDLAVITLALRLTGSYNDEAFDGKFKYIRVWKKFPDGIKVIGGSGRAI